MQATLVKYVHYAVYRQWTIEDSQTDNYYEGEESISMDSRFVYLKKYKFEHHLRSPKLHVSNSSIFCI